MLAPLLLSVVLAVQNPDTAHVVIVATSDVHGHVMDWDYARGEPYPGGLTRAATIVDSLRTRYPDRVVLVDGGDATQGDPFAAFFTRISPRYPHPVTDVMNVMRYDATTPGDRDFDDGLPGLDRLATASTMKFVSGNIRVPGRDTLAFAPYVVLLRQGVRIAIGGFTTPGVMVWDRKELGDRLRITPIESSAEPIFRGMRRDADLTVVLSHSGLNEPSSYDTTGIGAENAAVSFSAMQTRPDLVILGHTHRELADSVLNGVHYVQPAPDAQGLSIVHVDLVRSPDGWRPVRITGTALPLATITPSPVIRRRMAALHAVVLRWAGQPVGAATGRMRAAAARVEDTPVIQFVNDVQLRHAGADISATPVLDLRAGFDVGDITVGQVLALYPSDNTLMAVRISGLQLAAYLERLARYFYVDSTGRVALNAFVPGSSYDVVSGIEYAIDLGRSAGQRITGLRFQGRPVAPGDSFTMALGSARLKGSGSVDLLRDAPVVYDQGESVVDLLLAEIAARHLLRPEDYAGTHWRLVPEEMARAARALFVRDAPPVPRRGPAPAPVLAVRPDPSRADSIERARQRADSLARQVVAELRLPIVRAGASSPLGMLVADAYRNALRADLALVALDELPPDLPPGVLTAAQYQAMPYQSRGLRRVKLTGADLEAVIEKVVGEGEPCCQISGAIVRYDPRARPQERVRSISFPSGLSLDRKATYTLAISERLATEASFPPPGAAARWQGEDAGVSNGEALLAYLRRLPQPVSPPEDSRFIATRP